MASSACLQRSILPSSRPTAKGLAASAPWLPATSGATRGAVNISCLGDGLAAGRQTARSPLRPVRLSTQVVPVCAAYRPLLFGVPGVPEPERRQELKHAILVEFISVAVWLAVSLAVYYIARQSPVSTVHWLLLPPLREACKSISNIINYAIHLWTRK